MTHRGRGGRGGPLRSMRASLALALLWGGHWQVQCFCSTPSMVLQKPPPGQASPLRPPSAAPPPPPPPPPPREPEGEGGTVASAAGVRIALGATGAEPFLPGTFPPHVLYALQQLQSDEEPNFGAAFIALNSGAANAVGEGGAGLYKGAASCRWTLGKLNATRMVALHRFKLWWMKPTHAKHTSDVPPETQLLLSEMAPDPTTGKRMYSLMIPLLDGPAKCSIKGEHDQHVQLLAETGCSKTPVPSTDFVGLFVAVHDDPIELLNKSFKLVTKRLSSQVKGGALGGLLRDAEHALYKIKRHEVVKRETDRSAPDMCNYLGWCTWDSFYTSVDSEKVFEGLKSLEDAGIKPRWLVLDDGWQSTSNIQAQNGEQWMDHLTSLVANSKFRDETRGMDLKDTVQRAKKDHNIKYFMVWHAIAGYWAGVDLDAPDLFKFKPQRARLTAPLDIVAVDPDMKMFFRVTKFLNKRFGVVPPEHIRAFYDDYHRYLRENGVDGVKVDAQSLLNFVGYNNGGSVEMSRAYHYALSRSVLRHFGETADSASGGGSGGSGDAQGGRIIHCMCHDNEILLTLPSCYARRPLVRGSDDFYPRDEASHGCHLYSNAFNALLISNCGLQDWDMFQTTLGPVSWMHAASRAISGGPVYISDRPGAHDTDILRRIVLEDGSVLRPVHNALPTARTMFDNPQALTGGLLTLWNENPAPGHAVLGAFNIRGSHWSQARRAYAFIGGAQEHLSEEVPGSFSPHDAQVLVRQLRRERADAARGPTAAAAAALSHAASPSHNTVAAGEAAAAARAAAASAAEDDEVYAVYLHRRGEMALRRLREDVPIALGASAFELAAVARVVTLPGVAGVRWASVGLADMFNAGGAVVAEAAAAHGARRRATTVAVTVKGAGRFLAHASAKPTAVTLDGEPLPFTFGPVAPHPYPPAEAAAAAGEPPPGAAAGGMHSLHGGRHRRHHRRSAHHHGVPAAADVGGGVAAGEGVMALEVELPGPYNGGTRELEVTWVAAQ